MSEKKLQYFSSYKTEGVNKFLKTIAPSQFRFAVGGKSWTGIYYSTTLEKPVEIPKEELTPEDQEIIEIKENISTIKRHRKAFISDCLKVLRANQRDFTYDGDLKETFLNFIIEKEPDLITKREEFPKKKKKPKIIKDATYTLRLLYRISRLRDEGIYVSSSHYRKKYINVGQHSNPVTDTLEFWGEFKKALLLIKKYAPIYLLQKYQEKVVYYGEETTICEGCGTENVFEANFCNECGGAIK